MLLFSLLGTNSISSINLPIFLPYSLYFYPIFIYIIVNRLKSFKTENVGISRFMLYPHTDIVFALIYYIYVTFLDHFSHFTREYRLLKHKKSTYWKMFSTFSNFRWIIFIILLNWCVCCIVIWISNIFSFSKS